MLNEKGNLAYLTGYKMQNYIFVEWNNRYFKTFGELYNQRVIRSCPRPPPSLT